MFKQGDIVFVMHERSKLSRVIAWFMHSSFSHTALVCHTNFFGRELLTETSDFEVMNNYLDRYLKDPSVSLEVYRDPNLKDGDRFQIAYKSTEQLGNVYGYLQLISFAIRNIIYRITGKKIKNFFRQGQVCCSVVGYAYQNALGDRHWLGKIDPESYETEELRKMVSSNMVLIYKKQGVK